MEGYIYKGVAYSMAAEISIVSSIATQTEKLQDRHLQADKPVATKPESPEIQEDAITKLIRLMGLGQNVDVVV